MYYYNYHQKLTFIFFSVSFRKESEKIFENTNPNLAKQPKAKDVWENGPYVTTVYSKDDKSNAVEKFLTFFIKIYRIIAQVI